MNDNCTYLIATDECDASVVKIDLKDKFFKMNQFYL